MKETNQSIVCAKCTQHIKADEPKVKVDRFTYCKRCKP
jgi:hypothetical protein